MRKFLLMLFMLGCHLCIEAQFEGDQDLQQAFTTYMQQRMAPEAFRLDRLDTVLVFKGDLDRDGVDDAAIQWRQGQEQRIVTFSKKDDGYKMSAEADCVWIRQKRMVFDLAGIYDGWLSGRVTKEWSRPYRYNYSMDGRVTIERATNAEGLPPASTRYWARTINGEILGLKAAILRSEVAYDDRLKCNAKELLILSWPLHHLGKSSILWEFRFNWPQPGQLLRDEKHGYIRVCDPLGSEMEDTTTLIGKVYPAKKGRKLIVITWQEETNAEWDSQDHWAAFWDHGKWIPAMDVVFPPLDGRIFFDVPPDDPALLHEGWQVALHIQQATDEIIVAPANKLEIIQGVYPDLVAQMKATQVQFVWNRHKERFEAKSSAQ